MCACVRVCVFVVITLLFALLVIRDVLLYALQALSASVCVREKRIEISVQFKPKVVP